MDKKLIINTLSISRVILGFLFFCEVYFLNSNHLTLAIIFILVALSDFFDGRLARRYGVTDRHGEYIDILSDFMFIFFSTLSLILTGKIEMWYLLIIFLQIIKFFATSDDYGNLIYDTFGHLVALMFYAFPIVVILTNANSNTTNILTYFVTICALISLFIKITVERG